MGDNAASYTESEEGKNSYRCYKKFVNGKPQLAKSGSKQRTFKHNGNKIVWGCPKAIPTLQGSGEDAELTFGTGEKPICAAKLTASVGICDTCCCQEGLIKSNVGAKLVY